MCWKSVYEMAATVVAKSKPESYTFTSMITLDRVSRKKKKKNDMFQLHMMIEVHYVNTIGFLGRSVRIISWCCTNQSR